MGAFVTSLSIGDAIEVDGPARIVRIDRRSEGGGAAFRVEAPETTKIRRVRSIAPADRGAPRPRMIAAQ